MGIETIPTLLSFAGRSPAADALLFGAVGGKVADKLLGPKSAPTPEVKPLTPMPDPLAQEAARKQALLEQLSRRGRQSTILTADSGSGTTLGG